MSFDGYAIIPPHNPTTAGQHGINGYIGIAIRFICLSFNHCSLRNSGSRYTGYGRYIAFPAIPRRTWINGIRQRHYTCILHSSAMLIRRYTGRPVGISRATGGRVGYRERIRGYRPYGYGVRGSATQIRDTRITKQSVDMQHAALAAFTRHANAPYRFRFRSSLRGHRYASRRRMPSQRCRQRHAICATVRAIMPRQFGTPPISIVMVNTLHRSLRHSRSYAVRHAPQHATG